MFTKAPDTVVLERTACPLGCAVGDVPVLRGRDRLHRLPGEFPVVRCRGCGLMRTDPRPSPETIGFYYPDDYGPYQSTKVDPVPSTPGASSRSWKNRVRQLFQFNTERIPPVAEPGRMLEIGCASGGFLHRMAHKGWEVEGIEFSPRAGAAARQLGYPVHIGALEDAPDPLQPYDLVVGWMVLEHLHRPLFALQKLWRWTRPGGWLVLSVPNAASFEFRLFRERWYALGLPIHLYHFTPRTLGLLLRRSGWQADRWFFQRDLANTVASLGYVLEDQPVLPQIADAMTNYPDNRGRKDFYLYPLAFLLSLLRQTGRMTIWARRVDG